MNRKITIFTIVTVLGVVIDQVTKYWVRAQDAATTGRLKIEVIPNLFDIVHAENPGAALGMLGSLSEPWRIAIFVGFTIIAGVIVFDLFRRLPPADVFLSTTLALIFSGAVGNAIDRVFKPMWGDKATVTDFLHFYTDNETLVGLLESTFGNMFVSNGVAVYPSFNVADINLVVGVGMFLVHYLFIESRQTGEPEAIEGEDEEWDEDDEEWDEDDEDEATDETAADDLDDDAPTDETEREAAGS